MVLTTPTDYWTPFDLEAEDQCASQSRQSKFCAGLSAFVLGMMVAAIGLLTVQQFGLGDASFAKFFSAPVVRSQVIITKGHQLDRVSFSPIQQPIPPSWSQQMSTSFPDMENADAPKMSFDDEGIMKQTFGLPFQSVLLVPSIHSIKAATSLEEGPPTDEADGYRTSSSAAVSVAEPQSSSWSLFAVVMLITPVAFVPIFRYSGLRRATSPSRALVHCGLPSYAKWFQRTFSEAYAIQSKDDQFDHVYIDVQTHLHTAMREARGSLRVQDRFYADINRILHSSAPPLRSATLAADGPAPLLKLLTERLRGRKVCRQAGANTKKLSSLKLSPGTNFMAEFSDILETFAIRKSREKALGWPLVICDGPLVPGEAEVKLLGHLQQNDQEEASRSDATQHRRHAIYGGDSDLIIMVLVAYPKLCLAQGQQAHQADRGEALNQFRQNHDDGQLNRYNSAIGVPSRKTESSTSSLDVLAIDHDGQVLSAKKMAELIGRKLMCEGKGQSTEMALRAMLDLAFISIICKGNDYLPGLKRCHLEEMWDAHMIQLAKAGEGLSQDLFIVDLKSNNAAASISWGAVANLLYVTNAQENSAWRQAPEPQTKHSDARLYAKALIWNLNMYFAGEVTDYRFGPIIPTIKSETLWQLAMHLKNDALDSKSLAQLQRNLPVAPAIYNLLVQPLAGKQFVAPSLQPLMEETSPIGWLYSQGCTCAECYRLYEENLPFQRDISRFRNGDETMVAKYEAAQAGSKLVTSKIKKHIDAEHGGKPLLFKELPSVSSVETLARNARSQFGAISPLNHEMPDPAGREQNLRAQTGNLKKDYDERSWKLWKPRWIGNGATKQQSRNKINVIDDDFEEPPSRGKGNQGKGKGKGKRDDDFDEPRSKGKKGKGKGKGKSKR